MTVNELIAKLAEVPASDRDFRIAVEVIEDGVYGTTLSTCDIDDARKEQADLYTITIEQ
jgi:hypothetical protein